MSFVFCLVACSTRLIAEIATAAVAITVPTAIAGRTHGSRSFMP